MKHVEALRILPKYFEGGLDRPTTKAFHLHLNGCSDCRDQIKLMRDFKNRHLKRDGKDTGVTTMGRRKARGAKEVPPRYELLGGLNARKLASSRINQRRLAIQFLMAAGIFFLMVRFGVFKKIFE